MTTTEAIQLCIDWLTAADDLLIIYPTIWAIIIARKVFYA